MTQRVVQLPLLHNAGRQLLKRNNIYSNYSSVSFHTTNYQRDVYEITGEDDFKRRVMRSSIPVIVNFHADWCEPCLSLKPLLNKIVRENPGKIHLAEVMVDEHTDLLQVFEVTAVPAVLAIQKGQVTDKFIGLVSAKEITSFVNKILDQTKMRQLIFCLLLAVTCTLATPRVRRQAEGTNWWDVVDPVEEVVPPKEPVDDNLVKPPTDINNPREAGSDFNTHVATGDEIFDDKNGPVTRSGEECEGPGTVCVPYYQCGDGKVNTDGTGLIDIRAGSKCSRYLDVCCKDASQPPITPKPAQYNPGCGRRNDEGVHIHVGGLNVTQAQFGEYPWMVAILRVEKIGGEDVNLYLCGGSLIAPNVVLTAAHCVGSYSAGILKIRAGEWDTQSTYEIYPHQDRLAKHVIVHPDFNSGSLKDDYAVLVLESPVVLAPNVDTVCLPAYGDNFDYATCYATGWGKDKFGKEGRFQNILKQVALKVVPHSNCEKSLQTTRLGKYFNLHSSFLCAGGDANIDTCKGDGGSPLVCPKPSGNDVSYYQVGIVAWGIGCGENGIPGVYSDVSKGVNWIQTVIGPYLSG